MDGEFRFVLLDFGHPMKNTTIKNVVNSLQNILALAITFPGHSKSTYFGISFLNSEFTVLQSESDLRKNYTKFNKNVKALLKKMKNNIKITVPEYKYLLSNSIEMILRASQEKLKLNNSFNQSKNVLVKVAIVTKKTASILADIITDVSKKMTENFATARLQQNYKIIQILNDQDEKTQGTCDDCAFLKWTTCLDSESQLNYFFKDWFLNRSEKLQIILSKELNFVLQCDIDNFIVSPISMIFDKNYDLYSDVSFKATIKNPPLATLEPVRELEIINRLPVSNLCPTMVFGNPRRVCAARNSSDWMESQMNLKMFGGLCRELHQTEQGLLTKSVAKTEKGDVTSLHFLTSDGHVLLMNSVAPDELYLPKSMKSSTPNSSDDENASSLIKSCMRKIKFLNEYSPENFSSGLYEYLKKHVQDGQRKNLFWGVDPDAKFFEKKCRKKEFPDTKSYSKGDDCNRKKKKAKIDPKKELRNTHPALLSPEIVGKYRKVPSGVFNLLELGEDYNIGL